MLLGYMEAKGLSWKQGFRMNADWEMAERNAWRLYFDEILDGCLFHFGQANWRHVQQIGISVEYVEHGKVRLFVWLVLSMSHVPLERHDEAIRELRVDIAWFEEESNMSPRSRRLFEKVEEFFQYFMDTWINGRFPVEDWNYFDALDHTTTNAAESTNWRVFMKTGRRKPNVYTSVGVIKEDLKETERILDLLEQGKLKRRVETKSADKLAQKIRLKNMLLADQITLRSYMTAMGAMNVTLDQKTKDMLSQMRNDQDGPEVHRRRTLENVANLAINSQIQMILPPDGAGDSIGGGPTRERGRGIVSRGRARGRGRAGGRGRGHGRGLNVGTVQPNGKFKCNSCTRMYVRGRFQG